MGESSATPGVQARAQPWLGWGFLGCGHIARDFIQAISPLSPQHARFHACAARSLERAQEFAQHHRESLGRSFVWSLGCAAETLLVWAGVEQAYGSYEELCTDPRVDVVYVATLHPQHAEHAALALSHGKHVLVEKPMAVNTREAEQLVQLARDKRLFLAEGMWSRCRPAVRHVRKLLEERVIGDVHHVQADIGYEFSRDNARLWERALGGGGLMDVGVYPLAMVTLALGTAPSRISAVGKLSEDEQVDVYGSVTLEYASHGGAPPSFGTFQYSIMGKLPDAVSICGSKGRIEVHPPAHMAEQVSVLTYPHGRAGDLDRLELAPTDPTTETTTFAKPEPPARASFVYPGSEGFLYEAEAVTRAIRRGDLELRDFPLEESIATMRITDAIREQLGVKYDADDK